jgi:hypothetical protein
VNAQDLCVFESCPRRYVWTRSYVCFRISPIFALYQALDAGLRGSGEADAKNKLIALAGNPGLDITGPDVYDVAIHLAHLAGIVTAYLRGGDGAWTLVPPSSSPFLWEPAVYECPDGRIRRVVLVDRWGDDRKFEEARSWRSVGEICVTGREMLLNAVVIGSTHNKRRSSHWTRALTHPRNKGIRFKKRTGSAEFAGSWEMIQRESWPGTTEDWLGQMQEDGCFEDLVHSLRIAVPTRRKEFLADMARMEKEMAALPEDPAMRRAGCFGFSPCVFGEVCHSRELVTPTAVGYLKYSDLK